MARMTPSRFERAVDWFLQIVFRDSAFELLKKVPALPARLRRRRYRRAPRFSRPRTHLQVPTELLTAPGVVRDEAAAWDAFHTAPLRDFWVVFYAAEMWIFRRWARFMLPVLPRYLRGLDGLERRARTVPTSQARPRRPHELTDLIRAEAARLGLTAVGFAPYDPRYVFAEAPAHDKGSVVICVLEEDFDAEQSAPSREHERTAMELYIDQFELTSRLADYIIGLGYRAQPQSATAPFMLIPYAVEAGLGQMGYNGQLLTPGAGARVALTAINTSAELAHDSPVDYGIPGICARCKVCVRRCPVGAIPAAPGTHRGVTKTKLKTERCLPVVGQAQGCAICSKVCPVQRYGLEAVLAHFKTTGEILGKGSDELEGFTWPLDGKHYDAGVKPRIEGKEFLQPPGLALDMARLHEPAAVSSR